MKETIPHYFCQEQMKALLILCICCAILTRRWNTFQDIGQFLRRPRTIVDTHIQGWSLSKSFGREEKFYRDNKYKWGQWHRLDTALQHRCVCIYTTYIHLAVYIYTLHILSTMVENSAQSEKLQIAKRRSCQPVISFKFEERCCKPRDGIFRTHWEWQKGHFATMVTSASRKRENSYASPTLTVAKYPTFNLVEMSMNQYSYLEYHGHFYNRIMVSMVALSV